MRQKYAAPETRFSCIPLAARDGESHRRLGFKVMRGLERAAGCTGNNNVSAIKWLCPSIVRLGSPSESRGKRRYWQPNKRNVSYYEQSSVEECCSSSRSTYDLYRVRGRSATRRGIFIDVSQRETIARCNRGNNKWKMEHSWRAWCARERIRKSEIQYIWKKLNREKII